MNNQPMKIPVDKSVRTQPVGEVVSVLTRIAVALESIAQSLKATDDQPYGRPQ
jgi:hypothetical protein